MALKAAQGKVTLLDKATQPLRSIAKSFLNLGKSSISANKSMSKTQKAIDGISKAQNRLNRVNANIKKNSSGLANQAVGVAGLALSFKAALQPAINFEQSMKDLEAVAFGSADATVPVAENMKLLSEQAKNLGASTAFSASQAAEGQIYLAKAGFKTNQIIATMPALLDLASASGTELGRTSDILSDLIGAFGMKAKDSGKLADVMAAATSSANVDMETLFETLKVAAPIGIAAGQSMEGITTATALLGNVGIKGSMAGTALKNAFVNLASPAADGAKTLKKLGIATQDSAGNMLPMEQIMLNLGKKAKNLSQVDRIKVFDSVFGKIAMAGALNLEKAVTSGDFDKMLTNLQNSSGVAKKMATIRMDSTSGSITQLMSAVEGLTISIGSTLTPILRTTANVITQLTVPFQSLIQNNKEIIELVGVFAGIMIASKVVTLAYTATMWLITPAISAFSAGLKLAKLAMVGFNFVMGLNPVGAIVIGVTALIAAGVALYKNWEPVKKFFTDLWATLKSFDFSNIVGSFGKIASMFGFGDSEVNVQNNATTQIQPALAQQSIQNNSNTTVPVAVNVNIADGKQSVETSGGTKTDVFINNGRQM